MTAFNPNHAMIIGDDGDRRYKLISDANLDEFDTIILRPSGLSDEFDYMNYIHYTSEWDETCSSIRDRMDAIYDWVATGNTIVVILEKDFEPNLNANHSLSFNEACAPRNCTIQYKSGKNIRVTSNINKRGELEKYLPHIQYEATINLPGATPFFSVDRRTPGKEEFVGVSMKWGKGRVLVVPPAQDNFSKLYYQALISLIPSDVKKEELPAWTNQYQLPAERAAIADLTRTEEEITLYQESAQLLRANIEEIRKIKLLFSANDAPFAEAAKVALSEIGFQVEDGPHPRADIIASYGKAVAAIEAKGLEGSAKETNLRQVDRWKLEVDAAISYSSSERSSDHDLSRYGEILERMGVKLENQSHPQAKGILIIGTFRNLPLKERGHADFPSPLDKAIKTSKVCALTGLQLLGLQLFVRERPEEKERVANLLLNTAGVLLDDTWKSYLLSP